MPTSFARVGAWLGAGLLFLMFIAGMSRVLTMKDAPKIVRNGAAAVANLFKGVLK